MRPDEQGIRELHSNWINAVNAGDLIRLLTLMTDDAVFLNPGKAPFGRDGFSANFSAASARRGIGVICDGAVFGRGFGLVAASCRTAIALQLAVKF